MNRKKCRSKTGWLGVVLGLMLNGCMDTNYPLPTFEHKVDVSKPGVLFETDFKVPWNFEFAPLRFEFGFPHTGYELVMRVADTVPGRLEREQKEAEASIRKIGKYDITFLTLWRVIGDWGDSQAFGKLSIDQLKTYERVMEAPGAPILLKVILIPRSGTRKPIQYVTARNYGTLSSAQSASGQPLELVLDLSTFAQYGNAGNSSPQHKLLLQFPALELYGEYHLRVENLTPIALPPGIETTLVQRRARVPK